MAKISGYLNCTRCGKSFEWYCIIPNKITDPIYNVETLEPEKAAAKILERKENGDPERLFVYCKHCEYTNIVEM